MERETVTMVFIKGTSIRPEKYVRLVQDMYEDSKIVVSCVVGLTDECKEGVGSSEISSENPLVWRLIDEISLCGL